MEYYQTYFDAQNSAAVILLDRSNIRSYRRPSIICKLSG